jgi:hypothetical protein
MHSYSDIMPDASGAGRAETTDASKRGVSRIEAPNSLRYDIWAHCVEVSVRLVADQGPPLAAQMYKIPLDRKAI